MSDPGAFAVAGAEEQEGGEPPPLVSADVVVCRWGEGERSLQADRRAEPWTDQKGVSGDETCITWVGIELREIAEAL